VGPSVDSLTVAGAAPALLCNAQRTGFPFHPLGRTPSGHPKQEECYLKQVRIRDLDNAIRQLNAGIFFVVIAKKKLTLR
jgi:hypothetical protein